MRWLLLIALLVITNVATFYITKKNARPKRHSVESVQAEIGPATGVVIMGDSLVEDAKFPASLCGRQIVNAGIGGAGASTLLAIAEKMQSKPEMIVVSVGVNDAGDPAFQTKYSMLLDSLPKTRIALATLVQPGFEHINDVIKSTSEKKAASLINMGAVTNFKTRDGIHPVDQSYIEWREHLLDGIRQVLDCR
ncbi:lysophospholipase L1-like esterase [Bradyrhizobium sp. I1.8.5]|uniref:SGNH/GDSL hydrolase family protein n=1 Tax=Bradyrhizobium sp. I1.8.5 TaxID=3156365 RepID=UPI003391265A